LQKMAIKAYQVSLFEDKGPVHLNFPFRKPLEPFSYTDVVNKKISRLNPQKLLNRKPAYSVTGTYLTKEVKRLVDEFIKYDKGIIIAGPMEYDRDLTSSIKKISAILKYPVFADGLSQLRFNTSQKEKNIISNFNSFLKAEQFIEEHNSDIILQFGRTPTSSALENFLDETKATRYLVNFYGDKFDPSRNAKATLSIEPKYFCEHILSSLTTRKITRQKSTWLKDFVRADEISEKIKPKIINKAKFPNEASIISDILNLIPSGSNIFIGNSLPVRDLDSFVISSSKR